MSRKLVLTIKDGQMTEEATGFQGKGCESLITRLLEDLQLTPTEVTYKDEYHREQLQAETQTELS